MVGVGGFVEGGIFNKVSRLYQQALNEYRIFLAVKHSNRAVQEKDLFK